MKYIYSLVILLFLAFSSKSQNTPSFYAKDFHYLVQTMRELDPMLYKCISEEKFNQKVLEVENRLKNVDSRYKAIYIIQEFIFGLGDGHAGIISIYHEDFYSEILSLIPFSVYILKDELYIKKYEINPELNGTQILAIDNVSSKDIIDSLKIFFPSDGKEQITDFLVQPMFSLLYGAFCHQADTFKLSTKTGTIKLPSAIKGDSLHTKRSSMSIKSYIDPEVILKKEINDKYGYFRFIGFKSKINEVEIEKEFEDFISKLNTKKIPNAIIDLRYNSGGDPYLAGKMASYFSEKAFKIFENVILTENKIPSHLELVEDPFYYKFRFLGTHSTDHGLEKVKFEKGLKEVKPAAERYKGKVYVITGSTSKSSSTMFCKYLSGQNHITFVGSEASGAKNYFCASNHCKINLPSLNVKASFGLQLIELEKGSSMNQEPIRFSPQYQIEYSIEDLINKKDKEMDWIIERINKYMKE